MKSLLEAVESRGSRLLLQGGARNLGADEFLREVRDCARLMRKSNIRCLALLADNGPDWLVTDLAARLAGAVLVPLPAFFTPRQLHHVLDATAADALATDAAPISGFRPAGRLTGKLSLGLRRTGGAEIPSATAKVTFTSGTTAEPKGVCLSESALDAVAGSICTATDAVSVRRHLCVLPLAVLLENVAGVYGALLGGAELVVPPLYELGWTGSSSFDAARLLECLDRYRPQSMILLPQLLKALVAELKRKGKSLAGLEFVAVGGARIPARLITAARTRGVPVYEGYGLSECGSVVSLNVPGADLPGSVGKPLPGRNVRIGPRGHIEIRHPGYLGYLGCGAGPQWLDTGDIGHFDASGFLHIGGRSKNLLITAYGRNISPEWVESELLCEPGVLQAMVLGDAWPGLGALLVASPGADIESSVRQCNARLPDYARVAAWRRVEYMSAESGLATANGRLRRARVADLHRGQVDSMRKQLEGPEGGPVLTTPSNNKGPTCHSTQS